MTELVIDAVGKRYRRGHWALHDVSLRLGPGVVGLVGPNGAGKTTLLRILATLLAPTSGTVTWDGRDITRRPQALRQTLGYLPQDFSVYPQLTASEFLRYIGELKGLTGAVLRRRVEAVLAIVRLQDEAERHLRGFSGGMIRRVGIAQALLTEPRLLVLDEPTVGLDPAERMRFRETLAAVGEDRLVILSTHIIADVEVAATDLALLIGGHVVWSGTPAGLLADAVDTTWALTMSAVEFEEMRVTYQVSAAIRRGEEVEARLVATTRPHPQAMPVVPSLEEAYLFFAGDGRHQQPSAGEASGLAVNH